MAEDWERLLELRAHQSLFVFILAFFSNHFVTVFLWANVPTVFRISFRQMRFGQNDEVNKSSGCSSALIILTISLAADALNYLYSARNSNMEAKTDQNCSQPHGLDARP